MYLCDIVDHLNVRVGNRMSQRALRTREIKAGLSFWTQPSMREETKENAGMAVNVRCALLISFLAPSFSC